MANNCQKLVIVSGSTGDLGRAYLTYYSKQPDTHCYGLTRRAEENPVNRVTYLRCDLENGVATRKQIREISLDGVVDILLIHAVGKFKFETNGTPEVDETNDGIDDEVFSSNVGTFHNLVKPLIKRRKKSSFLPLKLVAFGSLSDLYGVPWWGSYSKSKLILRQDMRNLSRVEPHIKSLFVNLSSVKTSNERETRPSADTKYWLEPEEIVTWSVPIIENMQYPYLEVDLFNFSPDHHVGYYKEHDKLKDKWLREMVQK